MIAIGTGHLIRLVTSSANAVDVVATIIGNSTGAPFAVAPQLTTITSVGTTTIVGPPGAGITFLLESLHIAARGGSNTVRIEYFDGFTAQQIESVSLAANETCSYEDGASWRVLTVDGSLKGLVGPTGPAGATGATGATGTFAPSSANSMPANATTGVAIPTDLSIPTNAVVGRVGGNIVAAALVDAQVSASAAIALSKLATVPANALVVNPTASVAVPSTLVPATNTVVGRVAGNLVAAQLVDAQVAAGTLSNASHASMGDATVKGRALGAGTGAQQDLTRAQVEAILPDMADGTVSGRALGTGAGARAALTPAQLAAIAAPSLAGSGLVSSSGQLHAQSLYADVVASVPAIAVAGTLGFVDVPVSLTPLDPIAANDRIVVLPRGDGPPFSARVSAANTVRIGWQGVTAAIANAPFRVYKAAQDLSSPQPYVSSWLRVALATSDVNGISSLPDVLNNNPAVQATNSRKPALGAAANGLPTMTFAGDDAMSIPIIAANNATSAWGFACWLKATSLTAPTDNICAFEPPDSSGYKVICTRVNQAITFSAAKSDGSLNVRRGATGNVIANTTGWNFLTFEWDATGAGETQRFTITVNGGAPQTLSFINQAGTPGTITTLHAPTGVLALGAALSDASLQPMSGTLGPNLFFMNTKMAAATVGILTPAARLALMNFETPT